MLVLREDEIRSCVEMTTAIEVVEGAFASLARGEVRQPPPVGLDLPEVSGEVHLKGAHQLGAEIFVFKVACGFYDNPGRDLPSGSGLVLAFDATTGFPAALLLDNSYLTDLRTGAAGGVAARHLAPADASTAAVLGAGVQARMQLRALAAVRPLARARIWNRNVGRAEECVAEIAAELGIDAVASSSVEEAVDGAEVVVTTTPSRAPVLRRAWLGDDVHVTAVGSDGPDKQELDVDVIAGAARVVADHRGQCERLGEIRAAIAAGVFSLDRCEELGDLVIGSRPGRGAEGGLTVADLTGVGVQDAAITAAALKAATAAGLGQRIR